MGTLYFTHEARTYKAFQVQYNSIFVALASRYRLQSFSFYFFPSGKIRVLISIFYLPLSQNKIYFDISGSRIEVLELWTSNVGHFTTNNEQSVVQCAKGCHAKWHSLSFQCSAGWAMPNVTSGYTSAELFLQ